MIEQERRAIRHPGCDLGDRADLVIWVSARDAPPRAESVDPGNEFTKVSIGHLLLRSAFNPRMPQGDATTAAQARSRFEQCMRSLLLRRCRSRARLAGTKNKIKKGGLSPPFFVFGLKAFCLRASASAALRERYVHAIGNAELASSGDHTRRRPPSGGRKSGSIRARNAWRRVRSMVTRLGLGCDRRRQNRDADCCQDHFQVRSHA